MGTVMMARRGEIAVPHSMMMHQRHLSEEGLEWHFDFHVAALIPRRSRSYVTSAFICHFAPPGSLPIHLPTVLSCTTQIIQPTDTTPYMQ